MEMWQPAPRAWEEEPGRASTTRPPLKTTALSAVATHLVKASPRSITTAVFSPPLPRPSYSGMVVKTTVRRPRTQAHKFLLSEGRGRGDGARAWRRRGPRVAAARRARAVPGCASLHVGSKSLQASQSPVRRKKRHRRPRIGVRGIKGRSDQALRAPRVGRSQPGPSHWPCPYVAPGAETFTARLLISLWSSGGGQ